MSKPRALKMTPGIERVLRHIAAGRNAYSGVSGRSDYGGMAIIVKAIDRRGFVQWGDGDSFDRLTPAGEAALKETMR